MVEGPWTRLFVYFVYFMVFFSSLFWVTFSNQTCWNYHWISEGKCDKGQKEHKKVKQSNQFGISWKFHKHPGTTNEIIVRHRLPVLSLKQEFGVFPIVLGVTFPVKFDKSSSWMFNGKNWQVKNASSLAHLSHYMEQTDVLVIPESNFLNMAKIDGKEKW